MQLSNMYIPDGPLTMKIKTTIKYSNATLDERPLCKYCN